MAATAAPARAVDIDDTVTQSFCNTTHYIDEFKQQEVTNARRCISWLMKELQTMTVVKPVKGSLILLV